jgi:hypothetical protein
MCLESSGLTYHTTSRRIAGGRQSKIPYKDMPALVGPSHDIPRKQGQTSKLRYSFLRVEDRTIMSGRAGCFCNFRLLQLSILHEASSAFCLQIQQTLDKLGCFVYVYFLIGQLHLSAARPTKQALIEQPNVAGVGILAGMCVDSVPTFHLMRRVRYCATDGCITSCRREPLSSKENTIHAPQQSWPGV